MGADFETLYVFGAGGHGREIAWLAEVCWGPSLAIVLVVDEPQPADVVTNGREVRMLTDLKASTSAAFVAAVGNGARRRAAVAACERIGLRAATLVHPGVRLAPSVTLGPGVVIAEGCVLTTNIAIGAHTHVNVGASINHDVAIGAFSTLSPGVRLAGNVRVGDEAFLGIGATVVHGVPGDPLVIGDNAVVAAGACVTRGVDAGAMVAGVPAVRKR